ncbi:MAG: PBSX family phage terminase large subunit [Aeromonadaceae bacterium]
MRDYDSRYDLYYGGSGSGKSHFVAQKLLIKALGSKRKILVVRKVATTIRNSTWQLMTETIENFKLTEHTAFRLSSYEITLLNGSKFIFTGLDDPEKIKSIVGITDLWIEEATELTLEDFSQLDLRLRHPYAKNQQVYISFNPISKANWIYGRFFDEETRNLENAHITHTTYKDNRFLPTSYVETLENMRLTNYTYYTIYCLGEFGTLGKTVFTNWRISDEQTPRTGKLIVGLDFGFTNDPTSLIAAIVEDKKIYIFHEHYETGMLTNEIATMITNAGFSKSEIIADSAEQRLIEELRRSGIPRVKAAKKGKGSIEYGIAKVQEYEIIVNPSCTKTIEELSNYAYKKDKKTGEYMNNAYEGPDHLMDALRYAIQIVDQNPVKTFNKAMLGL